MRVVYYPKDPTDNAFTSIVQSGIERNGCEILDLDELLTRDDDEPIPVFLNWADEIHSRNTVFGFRQLIMQRLRIRRIVAKGGRIIYVVHNRVPHDTTSSSNQSFSLALRRSLCKSARCIVVLCDESKAVLEAQLGPVDYASIVSKTRKIPIPTYSGYYPDSNKNWRGELGIAPNSFLFVFSGFVRPYKGIELVFDVARYFKEKGYRADFLITGRCNIPDYRETIYSLADGLDNVHLSLEFVKNDELSSLLKSADAVLLPLDTKSSLNSSSCYLAFSYGKTVVCPLNGTLKEFCPELVYSYEDTSPKLRGSQIASAAERAYLDWAVDPLAFAKKGATLKSIVDTENSALVIGSMYKAAAEASLES